jgi:hypothetical protein
MAKKSHIVCWHHTPSFTHRNLPLSRTRADILQMLNLNILQCHGFFLGTECQEEEPDPELHPLDGWYNNLINPDWGAVGKSVL